jgi:hypothetical protein
MDQGSETGDGRLNRVDRPRSSRRQTEILADRNESAVSQTIQLPSSAGNWRSASD